jgi:hypothetical protein
VLSGIGRMCTSTVAAFRRANEAELSGDDAGLKTAAATPIVPS